MGVRVTAWSEAVAPTEASLRQLMQVEGLQPHEWGNRPGDRYAAHSHGYDKVIHVVSGSIWFGLPAECRTIELKAGDRLDLPRGIVHNATVGGEGVKCLEAHEKRRPGWGER